ncbi:MAG: hypothetical protein ABIN91_13040 [Mucilaginibacter sp.]|uniref:hypothetical protein n=1 Tax=Mucilaginibacter sp. TaxID=1882438 RepID=UPI0032677DF6
MKQFYLSTLLIIFVFIGLTSCNTKYRFVTRGLPDADSSYIVNKRGERIDATKIEVRRNTLTVDGEEMKLDGLTAIKSKKMYFVVNDGRLYFGEIYGKINLLYTISYTHTYGSGSNPGTTTTTKRYYLQKQDSEAVDQLTKATFLEYVGDNEKALSLAKAHYIWNYTSYVSFGGFIVGGVLLVKALGPDKTFKDYTAPLALAGGTFILHGVLTGISNHKLKKSIEVYNKQ